MSAGTIALTNNSTAVSGTGTSFTTELKVGDFIGVIAGGTPYTLIVASISSNTQLTIGGAFAGPTASDLAWNGVPASLLYAVTQQIMNDMGTALRGMNSQLVNWQKIYSDAPSVTVERPDRTTYTGPSWGYMAAQYDSKANTADVLTKADNLNSLTDKATARTNLGLGDLSTLNGPLAINKGGTGSATPFGTAANTFTQGNDNRLNTIDGKTGGTLPTGGIVLTNGSLSAKAPRSATPANGSFTAGGTVLSQFSANYTSPFFGFKLEEWTGNDLRGLLMTSDGANVKYWNFSVSGNATATSGSWVNGSDEILKENIQCVGNALTSVLSWRGACWDWKDKSRKQKGLGLIAQDVEKSFPDAISYFGTEVDGKMVEAKAIDPGSIAAAYHTEAIKSLFSLVELALVDPDKALASIDSIKAAINPD